jgi:hypothetical protein
LSRRLGEGNHFDVAANSAERRGFEPLVPLQAHLISKMGGETKNLRKTENSPANGDPSRPENGGARLRVGQSWGNPAADGRGGDEVDRVLASALGKAADAGRFDVVAQLARELEARRLARTGNVVRIQDEREKRGPQERPNGHSKENGHE